MQKKSRREHRKIKLGEDGERRARSQKGGGVNGDATEVREIERERGREEAHDRKGEGERKTSGSCS